MPRRAHFLSSSLILLTSVHVCALFFPCLPTLVHVSYFCASSVPPLSASLSSLNGTSLHVALSGILAQPLTWPVCLSSTL